MGSCQCSATTSITDDQKTQRIYIIFSTPSLTHSNLLRYLIATIGDGVIVSYQDGATLIYYAYIIYHISYIIYHISYIIYTYIIYTYINTYLQHIQTEPKWIHRILLPQRLSCPGAAFIKFRGSEIRRNPVALGSMASMKMEESWRRGVSQRNKKCKVESIVGFMFFCGHEISIAFIFCHHILSYLYIMILY